MSSGWRRSRARSSASGTGGWFTAARTKQRPFGDIRPTASHGEGAPQGLQAGAPPCRGIRHLTGISCFLFVRVLSSVLQCVVVCRAMSRGVISAEISAPPPRHWGAGGRVEHMLGSRHAGAGMAQYNDGSCPRPGDRNDERRGATVPKGTGTAARSDSTDTGRTVSTSTDGPEHGFAEGSTRTRDLGRHGS